MICKIKDLYPSESGMDIVFTISGSLEELDGFTSDMDVEVTVKKHKEKRSLDANAYLWVLIDKLASKTGVAKSEIYKKAIKEIGGNSDVLCLKNDAVETFCKAWESRGLGWQTDRLPSKIGGCTNVVVYYGSSTYNTMQMWLLIQNIVDECKEQGIETMTPEELDSMMKGWDK